MAVLRSVAIDAGIEVVAASGDLGIDESAAVSVGELAVRNPDLGNRRELGVPEVPHVREVRIETAGKTQRLIGGPGIALAEPIDGDDVVVVDRGPWADIDRCRVEGDESGGGLGIDVGGVACRIVDGDSAVDGNVGRAAYAQFVGEVRDRDIGTRAVER